MISQLLFLVKDTIQLEVPWPPGWDPACWYLQLYPCAAVPLATIQFIKSPYAEFTHLWPTTNTLGTKAILQLLGLIGEESRSRFRFFCKRELYFILNEGCLAFDEICLQAVQTLLPRVCVLECGLNCSHINWKSLLPLSYSLFSLIWVVDFTYGYVLDLEYLEPCKRLMASVERSLWEVYLAENPCFL